MNFYLHDILTQPQELTSFLKHYMESELQNELKKLASLSVKKVIFSGMGSSHFCALSASIILKQHGIE